MNRGNRENVIADKSALDDVEELNETLARIKNAGEYLGEFSFTVVLYGWSDQARLQRAAADVAKVFGNHEAPLIRETYNALNAYLSIIPGKQTFNLRRTWLLSRNYADLSFCMRPMVVRNAIGIQGGEHLVAFDLLDALNTGRAGSISTLCANSALQALSRSATLTLPADVIFPIKRFKGRSADLADLVIHIQRSGRRRSVESEAENISARQGKGNMTLSNHRVKPSLSNHRLT